MAAGRVAQAALSLTLPLQMLCSGFLFSQASFEVVMQQALNTDSPLQLLIVGGGTAGWLSALMIAWHFRASPQVQISLVEASGIATIGVGEGSTPALTRLLRQLDIDEADWMPACQATYKNGIQFCDWSTIAGYQDYFHPFPSSADNSVLPAFFARVRAAQTGQRRDAHPDQFFLQTYLAKHHKAPLAANSTLQLQYGYHFDAGLLGQYLKQVAISRGVIYRALTVDQVERSPDGAIYQLHCVEGVSLAGDFYFDCTGFASKLARQTLGAAFTSYQQLLPNDTALTIATAVQQPTKPQTTATALPHGWCWQIPLQHRCGNGYVFSRDFVSLDQAEHELRQFLQLPEQQGSCRTIKFQAGRLSEHWQHNCVAVGLSQGFIEPLEATALFLVQQSVSHFLLHWQRSNYQCRGELPSRQHYNQLINTYFDRVADYIALHYKTNSRQDSNYWRHNRQLEHISPQLRQLLQCWQSGGDVAAWLAAQDLEKYYHSVSWYCLLAGTGYWPGSANTPAEPEPALNKRWQQLAALCPSHNDQLLQLQQSLLKQRADSQLMQLT